MPAPIANRAAFIWPRRSSWHFFFLKHFCGRPDPTIGILNIGHESTKGPRAVQGAMKLLAETSTLPIRYVEPHTLFDGAVDGVVCDGFVGNAVLKLLEGVVGAVRQCFTPGSADACASCADAASPAPQRWLHRLVCRELGAAPLLGVRRTVLIAHGRSTAREIANAVLEAEHFARAALFERMGQDPELLEHLAVLRGRYTHWMLTGLKNRWRFGMKKAETDKGGEP